MISRAGRQHIPQDVLKSNVFVRVAFPSIPDATLRPFQESRCLYVDPSAGRQEELLCVFLGRGGGVVK